MAVDKTRPGLSGKWCPAADEQRAVKGAQYIFYDKNAKGFYWLPSKPDPDEEGLRFDRFEPPVRGANAARGENFGDTFKGSHIAQLTYPFYGYNPGANVFGSRTASLWSGFVPAGTNKLLDYKDSNPEQDIQHALLFEFPHPDSHDYERGVGLGDNPFLPLGLTGIQLDAKSEHAHTEQITSTYDTARSWSLTLGLNAGVKKMLSLSASTAFS
jgi:hypothetical protein